MHKFLLSDDELKIFEQVLGEANDRIEYSIRCQKRYPSSPDRIALIEALEDYLIDLDCVSGHLFEGGDD